MTRWNQGHPDRDMNIVRAGLLTDQVTVIIRAAIRITPAAVCTIRTGPPAALGTTILVPLPLRMTILTIQNTEMSLKIIWLGREEMRGALAELGGMGTIYRDLILVDIKIMTMMILAVLLLATALECLEVVGIDNSNRVDWQVFCPEG